MCDLTSRTTTAGVAYGGGGPRISATTSWCLQRTESDVESGEAFSAADEWNRASRDYQAIFEPFTRHFAQVALSLLNGLGPETDVIDVAAGTGPFAVAAAALGANILATDLSPAMVDLLGEALAEYPSATARVMNGEALSVKDGQFDLAVSIFGVMLFPNWRTGLAEMARVVRPGGQLCVATWARPVGSGPVLAFVQAHDRVLPHRTLPSLGEGLAYLSSPHNLAYELSGIGLNEVRIHQVEGYWTAPSAAWAIDNVDRILGRHPGFATLSNEERDRLLPVLRDTLGNYEVDGEVRIASVANIAVASV
jgi:SAM-dependent methyltransferase